MSEALSRSLAEEQAKAAVQLRKRCEAAEEKQLETEQKLAAALRAIEELRARPEEARETGTGSGSGSGTGTANVSGIGTGSGSPKSSGNGSGSGFESGSASGKTSGNGTGIRPEPGRSNGVAGQEAATTSARGKENAEGGLASRDGVGRKAAVGGSRLRPASAHPRLQVALPPEVESNGTERERQLNNAREVDVSKEVSKNEQEPRLM